MCKIRFILITCVIKEQEVKLVNNVEFVQEIFRQLRLVAGDSIVVGVACCV
jgi:hypothetical protein